MNNKRETKSINSIASVEWLVLVFAILKITNIITWS